MCVYTNAPGKSDVYSIPSQTRAPVGSALGDGVDGVDGVDSVDGVNGVDGVDGVGGVGAAQSQQALSPLQQALSPFTWRRWRCAIRRRTPPPYPSRTTNELENDSPFARQALAS